MFHFSWILMFWFIARKPNTSVKDSLSRHQVTRKKLRTNQSLYRALRERGTIIKKWFLIKESNIATETVLLKYCLRIKLIVAICLLYIYKGTMYNTTIIPPKKCFERLVKAHITSSLHTTLGVERSTDDAIATALQLCYPGSSGKEKQLCADALHRL